jgi:hypothetical protein
MSGCNIHTSSRIRNRVEARCARKAVTHPNDKERVNPSRVVLPQCLAECQLQVCQPCVRKTAMAINMERSKTERMCGLLPPWQRSSLPKVGKAWMVGITFDGFFDRGAHEHGGTFRFRSSSEKPRVAIDTGLDGVFIHSADLAGRALADGNRPRIQQKALQALGCSALGRLDLGILYLRRCSQKVP